MKYIIVPQWYGAYKKGPDVGALRLAELINKEGSTELTCISIPDESPGEDHLMPFTTVHENLLTIS